MGAEKDTDLTCGADAGQAMQALGASQTHGPGFCSAAWCQIDGSSWHAVTAGQDGKLVLRAGDEDLTVVKVSGDHSKPAHCVAASPDGKWIAAVDDSHAQARPSGGALPGGIQPLGGAADHGPAQRARGDQDFKRDGLSGARERGTSRQSPAARTRSEPP